MHFIKFKNCIFFGLKRSLINGLISNSSNKNIFKKFSFPFFLFLTTWEAELNLNFLCKASVLSIIRICSMGRYLDVTAFIYGCDYWLKMFTNNSSVTIYWESENFVIKILLKREIIQISLANNLQHSEEEKKSMSFKPMSENDSFRVCFDLCCSRNCNSKDYSHGLGRKNHCIRSFHHIYTLQKKTENRDKFYRLFFEHIHTAGIFFCHSSFWKKKKEGRKFNE